MRISGALKVAVFLLVSVAGVYAASGGPGSQEVQKVKIPQTAAEHRAMAESYRAKAVAYEREAEDHRRPMNQKISVSTTLTRMEVARGK